MSEGYDPGSETFGALVRRHRLALGLSQEELAGRSALSVRAIADMERGRTRRPRRYSVQSLGDALGLLDPQRRELDRAARFLGAGEPDGLEPSSRPHDGQMVPARAGERPDPLAVPRQLPAAISHFTGRATELGALAEVFDETSRARTLVISALAGTAGVGKTALAIQWAHQVADRFPDGQLYVNLRGYDPHEPVAAADALAGLLGALGVPGQQIPAGAPERAALYRTRLAGRRVLLLLDNARDSDQVRPLLPGDPGCVVVVTSRDALAGLVVTDGARRLDLDVLPLADAIALLLSLIGQRAFTAPEAVAELARVCARLPLALRIAAELACARPTVALAELVAELAESRLDNLDTGDDRADIRAVFSWSIRQLPDHVCEAFALVGLHPGEDIDVHAASALTSSTVGQARQALDRLRRASLLQAADSGRYSMHDLLRGYAREMASVRDLADRKRQAQTQLFDYYMAAASAAMDVLYPAEVHRRPRATAAAAVMPEMVFEADAQAWLDRERTNLVAVVVHCAERGWPGHATFLAATLFRYLMTGSHLPEASTIYWHALQAARLSSDVAAEAEALNGLGSICIIRGHFRDAADHYREALECYHQCGNQPGQARVLHNLGSTEQRLHNYESSASYCRRAIAAFENTADKLGAARPLADLAEAETRLGHYDAADEHLRAALSVFRAAGDRVGEGQALSRIGDLSLRRGQLNQAADYFEQSLAMFQSIGHPAGVAAELGNLGEVLLRQGSYQEAIGYTRQALDQFRRAGDQYGETMTLRSLAEAMHGTGQPVAARALLADALRAATETGNTRQQADVHRELAESYHQTGEHDQAKAQWQDALDLYAQLAAPEAGEIQSRLSELRNERLDDSA